MEFLVFDFFPHMNSMVANIRASDLSYKCGLIPKEIIPSPKKETYQSKFPPNIHPTGSTFGLKSTSFPAVCNLNGDFILPRGAHPMKQMHSSFGKPDGTNKHDPSNFIKQGHIYKTSPKPEYLRPSSSYEEKNRKPKIPSINEKPIMGLQSNKNYIISNAVDIILSKPGKIQKVEEDFLNKSDYGRIPKYLTEHRQRIEKEYDLIREMQAKTAKEENEKKMLLNEEEANLIKTGLNKKLEGLRREYATFTHKTKTDTIKQKNKMESIEKEMQIIEKDLTYLNKKNIYVDMTRA